MFGYTGEEIVGRSVDVLFTPGGPRAAASRSSELEQARRDGRAADERYHLRKDGTAFYCSGVTTPLGDGASSASPRSRAT